MKDTDYNIGTFAFTAPNPLWEHILYIVDLNIQSETSRALQQDVVGETRVHQCGRASAMTDFKTLLLEERAKALKE